MRADKFKVAVYTQTDSSLDHNPMLEHKAECAFPSATQNEISEEDAKNLVKNGCTLVSEGANMPTEPSGVDVFLKNKILFGLPSREGEQHKTNMFFLQLGLRQKKTQD